MGRDDFLGKEVIVLLTLQEYQQGAASLRRELHGFSPDFLLVLGSGLGFLADLAADAQTIPYAQIPHMRSSTAPGHTGRFVAGLLGGKRD